MSQEDFEITTADANTGVTFRAAVNAALKALATVSSGATAPSTPYGYQLWADTTSGYLKMRNASNSAWIQLWKLSDMSATATEKGIARLATNAEAEAGTGNEWIVTPGNLAYVLQRGQLITGVASGTNTYTASLSPAITSYTTRAFYLIEFTNANTGASTLNLNAIGAKTIVKEGSVALVSGDIPAGHVGVLYYNGINMVLCNPAGLPASHKTVSPIDHPDGSVTTAKIADANVTTAKIADSAVTQIKALIARQQLFTASGTFDVPVGVTTVWVSMSGGGGGGGNGNATYAGGGGGGAHAVIGRVLSVTPSSAIAVTIGAGGAGGTSTVAGAAGGTSSFGALLSTPGGGGGGGATTVAGAAGAAGGVGGSAGTGGSGGSSIFGAGAAYSSDDGGHGGGHGGGGSGGGTGGNGSPGFCLIQW